MTANEFFTIIAQISGLLGIVCSMLAMGLGLTLSQITQPLKAARLVILALLANFVLVPLLAYGITLIIPIEQSLKIGLIVLAICAGALRWVLAGGGDRARRAQSVVFTYSRSVMYQRSHMNKYFRSGLLLVVPAVTLLLTACEPAATATPSDSIQGIVWQWTSVSNKSTGETTTVPNPENYTITFNADGTLNGLADCNTFTGTYSQENGFSITLGATTMAFCGEASLDQQYLTLLGSVAAGGPDGAGGFALETAGGEQRMEFKMEVRRRSKWFVFCL